MQTFRREENTTLLEGEGKHWHGICIVVGEGRDSIPHFFTTRARLTGATVPSPETTLRDTRSFPDEGFTCQHLNACARWVSVYWPRRSRSRRVPPRHPEPHAHSLCAPDPAEMGDSTAVPPLPGRLRLYLGSDSRPPECGRICPLTQRRKTKVPAERKGRDPDAPPPSAPANHRLLPRSANRTRLFPAARIASPGSCSAYPLSLSLALRVGLYPEASKLSSKLQVKGYVYNITFREQLKGSYVCRGPNWEILTLAPNLKIRGRRTQVGQFGYACNPA